MRENLEKRGEILMYLAQREVKREGAPTIKEVGEAVGLRSTQTVYKHLRKLEDAGYIERESGRARGLKLSTIGWEAVGQTPLLGRIAAGRGLEAVVNEGETLSLPADLMFSPSGRDRYALQVVGQSMTGARIEDGDYLVVERNEDPPDGTVVVALIGNGEEVTVKRLYREKDETGEFVRLSPENGDHKDLVVPADDVLIQGTVIYVVHPPEPRS